MALALATYKNRITSLFESSDRFVIIDLPPYNVEDSHLAIIKNNSSYELLQALKKNNVNILICGAISGCILHMLEANNIQVIPWITGDIQNVVQAYHSGNLISPLFLMPGCRRRGRHGRPNTYQTLMAAGIRIFQTGSGPVA